MYNVTRSDISTKTQAISACNTEKGTLVLYNSKTRLVFINGFIVIKRIELVFLLDYYFAGVTTTTEKFTEKIATTIYMLINLNPVSIAPLSLARDETR